VELSAEGSSLPEAFAGIGLGLFAAAVDPSSVGEGDVREVRACGGDVPALLRQWLQECLYVHEVEGFACRAIDFAVFDAAPAAGGEALRLHALLRGEVVDPTRHLIRAVIRNIREDKIRVDEQDGHVVCRATLEL
jgi:SHS2 domain-containing protein